MGDTIKANTICDRKPESTRPRARIKSRWKNVTKMILKEFDYEGVDKIRLVQNKYKWLATVNTTIYPRNTKA
jgi:hypothetical protein